MTIGGFTIAWCWWKVFRKDWYTGNRMKQEWMQQYHPEYRFLYDLGPLTIALIKDKTTLKSL
jgi:hypothetical protein